MVFNYRLRCWVFIQLLILQIFIDRVERVRGCNGPAESYRCEPVLDPDPRGLLFRRAKHMDVIGTVHEPCSKRSKGGETV